jgi:hypothetical protein
MYKHEIDKRLMKMKDRGWSDDEVAEALLKQGLKTPFEKDPTAQWVRGRFSHFKYGDGKRARQAPKKRMKKEVTVTDYSLAEKPATGMLRAVVLMGSSDEVLDALKKWSNG